MWPEFFLKTRRNNEWSICVSLLLHHPSPDNIFVQLDVSDQLTSFNPSNLFLDEGCTRTNVLTYECLLANLSRAD